MHRAEHPRGAAELLDQRLGVLGGGLGAGQLGRRSRAAPPSSASAAPATRGRRSGPPPRPGAVTALSSLIIEPWPARPRAVSRIQAMPFSAALDAGRAVARARSREKPPTSPTASVQPSKSSAWSSIERLARPGEPPASSSAVKHSTSGRRGTRAGAGPGPHDGEQHRVEVLHVDRAAAPHVAVAGPRRRTGRPASPPRSAGTTSRWPCTQQRVVARAVAAPARDERACVPGRPR